MAEYSVPGTIQQTVLQKTQTNQPDIRETP
jgi:hypothetical protein